MRGSLTFHLINWVCGSCGRREDTTRKEAKPVDVATGSGHMIYLFFGSTSILKPPAENFTCPHVQPFLRYHSDLIYSQPCVSFIDCHFAVFYWIWQSFDSDRSHLAFIDALDGFQWFACWRITGEWGSTVSILFLAVCIIQFSQSAFFPLESGRWPSQIGRLQPISV